MKTLWTSLLCLIFINCSGVWAADTDGGDLTVSEVVAVVLENNPAVQEAEANIAAAKASVKSSRAEMLPEAEISYGYTSLVDPPFMKVGGGEMQTSHQRIYNWDVTVIQPLFTGFALESKLNISKLDVTARQLEQEQVILDLTRNAKGACYNLLLAQRLLIVNEDEVAALTAHTHNAELFYNQGLIRKNDMLQAQVALANSKQQLEKARAEVRKARMSVNRLMNRPLEAPVSITDENESSEPQEAFDLDSLGASALRNRPLMRLLDVGLEQLGLTEKIAKSAWYPSLALVGKYERIGDDPAGTNNDYANDHNASITARLQWNFWAGGKTRADVENTHMKMRSLEAGISRYRQQILEEVRSSVLDCEVARGNIETAVAALEHARENWRITDLQYREQTALASDVLDARSFLTQADANYYRSVYEYLNAVAALERSVGKTERL